MKDPTLNGNVSISVSDQQTSHFFSVMPDSYALLAAHVLPVIAKRIDLLALTTSKIDEIEASQELQVYRTRPLLQEFSDFVLAHQIKPDRNNTLPPLLNGWIDASTTHASLYRRLEKEAHLLEPFNEVVQVFENLFAPNYGVIPTTAGIIRCLNQEINAIKLRLGSKVGIFSNVDPVQQTARLYIDVLRHYPYVGYVDPLMRSFRLISEQGLRDALAVVHLSLLIIADFLVGLPLLIPVTDLAMRLTGFTGARGQLLAEIIDCKAADGDDFKVLAVKVLRKE